MDARVRFTRRPAELTEGHKDLLLILARADVERFFSEMEKAVQDDDHLEVDDDRPTDSAA